MADEFKLHEKSKLQLDFKQHERDRQTHHTMDIPMYFEYQHDPIESYHLPESHQPTKEGALYSVATYFDFCRSHLSMRKDEYGDDLVLLMDRPFATIWWVL